MRKFLVHLALVVTASVAASAQTVTPTYNNTIWDYAIFPVSGDPEPFLGNGPSGDYITAASSPFAYGYSLTVRSYQGSGYGNVGFSTSGISQSPGLQATLYFYLDAANGGFDIFHPSINAPQAVKQFTGSELAQGWKSLDVTSELIYNLQQGDPYAEFSFSPIDPIAQTNYFANIASMTHPEGKSPYLVIIPEPSGLLALGTTLGLFGGMIRRKRLKG